jgi:SH3 domain-containing YSC84-like protein 1
MNSLSTDYLGSGLVISRLSGGRWSAPSAISCFGLSWGAVFGMEVTDHIIVLNTDAAVAAFTSSTGQLTLGAGLAIAVGPVGRSGSADVHFAETAVAPAYSYSQTRGFYAGVSLDGAVVLTRNEVNFQFYARPVTAEDILGGAVPPPRAADVLYNALNEALGAAPDVQHAIYQQSVSTPSSLPT